MSSSAIDIFNPTALNYVESFIEKYNASESFNSLSLNEDSFDGGFYGITQLLHILQDINLLKKDDSTAEIAFEYDENFTTKQNLVLRALQTYQPAWLERCRLGLNFLDKSEIDANVHQCLKECGVFEEDISDQARAFCLKLKELANQSGQDNSFNIETGARGEELSIEFEFIQNGVKPRQESLYNDLAGYDLLSKTKQGFDKRIEVKASRSNQAYISWNEWSTALKSISQNIAYEFHFWDLNPEKPMLAIIDVDQLDFIPGQHSDNHRFEKYIVNFLPFKECFKHSVST
ncbi:DUF3883 domain-containing protein [Gammaproteobacteria bacterium]|nr:DUF3883 domain-containing protein [Gammaproteobacteria bacterium]